MEINSKPIIELSNWDKNESARTITEDNFTKLKLSLKRYGIRDPFSIDETGVVYDGNNRLKALRELASEGILVSENGNDLTNIPCINKHPQTEADKWAIALSGNEQFASWDQEGLSNYLPEFENEIDISLFNVDFFTPNSMIEQLDKDEIKPSTGTKQVTCPSCGHVFDK